MRVFKAKEFYQAIEIFPDNLKPMFSSVDDEIKEKTWEIRLRGNLPIMFVGDYGKGFLCKDAHISYLNSENTVKCSMSEINDTFNKICGYSVHTHQKDICNGFVTIEGGHRVGFCGTAVVKNEKIETVKDINSINLRISRQHIGASKEIVKHLFSNGLKSVIIAGPPLSGKTTVLRDLARSLSSKLGTYNNICVIDERNELAAVSKGKQYNDLGLCCDILSGFPKADGIIISLRTLSPDLIICDEIGNMNEVTAIKSGLNTGVKYIISVHANGKEDILIRPQTSELLATKEFEKIVFLKGRSNPGEIKEIIETSDLNSEIFNSRNIINYEHSNRIFV